MIAIEEHELRIRAARGGLEEFRRGEMRVAVQHAVEIEEDQAPGASAACYPWGTGLRKSFEAHHDPDRAPC